MIFEMCIDDTQHKFLNSELRRVSRSEAIMTNFARALWTVLKQYKHKLLVILSAYFFSSEYDTMFGGTSLQLDNFSGLLILSKTK
jgi:hypothetical protein